VYSLFAGLIAASVVAWYWRSRANRTGIPAADEYGTVIFDNTPRASTPDGNLNL
jgi:hypothetical protein